MGHFSIGELVWPVLGPGSRPTGGSWIHTFNLTSEMAEALSGLIVGMVAKQLSPAGLNCFGVDFEKVHKAIMKQMRLSEDKFGSGWHCTIRWDGSDHGRPAEYNEACCGGH